MKKILITIIMTIMTITMSGCGGMNIEDLASCVKSLQDFSNLQESAKTITTENKR